MKNRLDVNTTCNALLGSATWKESTQLRNGNNPFCLQLCSEASRGKNPRGSRMETPEWKQSILVVASKRHVERIRAARTWENIPPASHRVQQNTVNNFNENCFVETHLKRLKYCRIACCHQRNAACCHQRNASLLQLIIIIFHHCCQMSSAAPRH